MMRIVVLASVLLSVACSEDLPAPPNEGTTGGAVSTSSTSLGTTMGTTTAATDGTGASSSGGPETLLDANLDLEVGEAAHVVFVQSDDDTIAVTLTLDNGYGVAPSGTPIEGTGRVDAYPEAGATVFTARFDAPADTRGPCGDRPIALALALHRDEDASYVAGGLTPYCGERAEGRPVIEPLRLSNGL